MAAPNLVEVQTLPTPYSASEMDRPRRNARLNNPRWSPQKWHPVYEEIVLLSALGYSNIDIAKDKGFTVVHISNILNTPQAKVLMRLALAQIEAKRVQTIDARLNKIAERAIERVEETLDNDVYATKNPGGMFDRALKLLQVTGRVKDPDAVAAQRTNTLVVPSDLFEKFTQAMERSRTERKELEGKVEVGTGVSFTTVKG